MTECSGDNPLGRGATYDHGHDPGLLHPVPRSRGRGELGVEEHALPFRGRDDWNAYELSWLRPGGKPEVALAQFSLRCDSPNLIESKSLKLYLNGLANTEISGGADAVRALLERDLSACAEARVGVRLWAPDEAAGERGYVLAGTCLDELDVGVVEHELNPALLAPAAAEHRNETLYTRLLRSLCPVTAQPDWATVIIGYEGSAIPPEGLLRYLISFRNHSGFHEQVVERIFVDLQRRYAPERLSVQARFTRRGGLDINPFRSTHDEEPQNRRTVRQ